MTCIWHPDRPAYCKVADTGYCYDCRGFAEKRLREGMARGERHANRARLALRRSFSRPRGVVMRRPTAVLVTTQEKWKSK